MCVIYLCMNEQVGPESPFEPKSGQKHSVKVICVSIVHVQPANSTVFKIPRLEETSEPLCRMQWLQ